MVPLWPEDFRLSNVAGRLRQTQDQWYFTFSDQSAYAQEPVRILPNSRLANMETYASAADRPVEFGISADVTEYGGENYLLVRDVSVLRRADQKATEVPEPAEKDVQRATVEDEDRHAAQPARGE